MPPTTAMTLKPSAPQAINVKMAVNNAANFPSSVFGALDTQYRTQAIKAIIIKPVIMVPMDEYQMQHHSQKFANFCFDKNLLLVSYKYLWTSGI